VIGKPTPALVVNLESSGADSSALRAS